MNHFSVLTLANGSSAPLSALPVLAFTEFRLMLTATHARTIDAFFVENNRFYAVWHNDEEPDKICAAAADVPGRSYPAFTTAVPAFHWFEREIFEQTGIVPEGHPWLKPIRFTNENDVIGVTNYFTMEGDSTHEVAVGPVHAGVIEPGHFRFQCMGEDVYSLEISLGYQHRGIEKMLTGGPSPKTLPVMEVMAGDTSTAAAGNYCRMIESLSGITVSPRSEAIRAIAWELERIANHIGDLGALAGDVAYLPTASYCGRIRGDFLNMTALLCGNRFGRGLIVPGGTSYDLDQEHTAELLRRLEQGEKDLNSALDLMFDSPSVLDRLENTGTVSTATAKEAGLVGAAARASGIRCDIRTSHAYGWYKNSAPEMAFEENGDVAARAKIRQQELTQSIQFIKQLLQSLPDGKTHTGAPELPDLMPDAIGVTLAEAWRGQLCHVALTDHNGKFARYKVVDPSFHNWFGLAMALRGEQISNFPICNKSFNLSYCGHDL